LGSEADAIPPRQLQILQRWQGLEILQFGKIQQVAWPVSNPRCCGRTLKGTRGLGYPRLQLLLWIQAQPLKAGVPHRCAGLGLSAAATGPLPGITTQCCTATLPTKRSELGEPALVRLGIGVNRGFRVRGGRPFQHLGLWTEVDEENRATCAAPACRAAQAICVFK